ncbi:MAG: hypothetical protein HYX90_10915 [Chloroflexi bacterium]|nr:hypothetical protein [Chloroflexota bacterium]
MNQPKTTPAKKKSMRLVQAIIFVAVLALIWIGFGKYVMSPAQSSGLPQYLGPLRLASQSESQAALTEIDQLHGTSIPLKSAFIADYRAPYGGHSVKVWAGDAGSKAAAQDLIDRMVKGIEKGNAPFKNPRLVKTAGQEVWQADGPGGSFYFYISAGREDRVVWLSIHDDPTLSLLEPALKAF